jgi:hypothetical protein
MRVSGVELGIRVSVGVTTAVAEIVGNTAGLVILAGTVAGVVFPEALLQDIRMARTKTRLQAFFIK